MMTTWCSGQAAFRLPQSHSFSCRCDRNRNCKSTQSSSTHFPSPVHSSGRLRMEKPCGFSFGEMLTAIVLRTLLRLTRRVRAESKLRKHRRWGSRLVAMWLGKFLGIIPWQVRYGCLMALTHRFVRAASRWQHASCMRLGIEDELLSARRACSGRLPGFVSQNADTVGCCQFRRRWKGRRADVWSTRKASLAPWINYLRSCTAI